MVAAYPVMVRFSGVNGSPATGHQMAPVVLDGSSAQQARLLRRLQAVARSLEPGRYT
jgi:hypothetical protein